MNARVQQIEILLRERKTALLHQDKLHQQRIQEQRKVFQAAGPNARKSNFTDGISGSAALTPRMSFEEQLTDAQLKQLLEKVFNAADEDNTGTHMYCSFSSYSNSYRLM